ncbi:MAG: ABC transporter permease [Firmicutes bacterium]|nr:ABC transporter permease [Bacillota bacterium]
MTIFQYTLKRLLRNKVSLLLILAIPSLSIGLIFGLGDYGPTQLTVGIVDQDGTPLTEMLVASLTETSPVTTLSEEDIRSSLAESRVDYILVIESGFTEQLLNNKDPQIQGYSIQETNISRPIKVKVESFLGAARGLAAAAESEAAFYQGMEDYRNGSLAMESEIYAAAGQSIDAGLGSMGFLAMTMLFFASYIAIHLIKDRQSGTVYRVLTAPVTLRSYMLQNITCFFLVLLVQILVVLVVVRRVFGIFLGPNVLNLFVVMAVFALLCVALGVAVAALARKSHHAGTIASVAITPMSMLGGLLWPRDFMPDFLQTIGRFFPTAWIYDAYRAVMLGEPLANAGLALMILLAFALVFFLLGTWRQTDVAR